MTDQVISSGVTSFGLIVSAGETLTVDKGGTSIQTHVSSGGAVLVSGLTEGDTISSGGVETILSGGSTSDTGVFHSGRLIIVAGGFANAGDANDSWIFDAGTLSGGSIDGHLQVQSGGTIIDTLNDRDITILRGGLGQHTTVSSGGFVQAKAGANTTDDVVLQAGIENVSGRDYRTVVSRGGQLEVLSKGVATNIQVSSGGKAILDKGGALHGGFLSGGTLSAKAGSTISAVLTVKGGAKAIVSGTVASGADTVLRSGGTLELANVSGFHGAISGMIGASQKLDLLGFAFNSGETASWAQSGTSGTLKVTDGGQVAHLELAGNYTASGFDLATDSHGGTIVTARFAQAAAALSKDAGLSPLVHAGGRAGAMAPPAVATSGRA